MVRVYDAVPDLELDMRERLDSLEILLEVLFHYLCDDVLLCPGRRGKGPARHLQLRLQVAVNQVDLLLAAKALADVLRPDLADAVDGLQLAIGGGEQSLKSSEFVDDPLHNELGQSWNAPQDADSARRHGIIEGVQLAVVAQQLG